MIAKYTHERAQHQGRGFTVNALRQAGYWIIGCKNLVGSIINSCVICRKCRRPLEHQKMAQLPKARLEETPPFSYVGVDFFGPFYIRQKRSEIPRYGVLFTCLMCRAIHLEVASSLETDAFINCLRRFIAIRGPIRQLYCDCGTNFVGAQNELAKELDSMNKEKIKNFLLIENCDFFEFKFNTPHASHMAGVWERQIRTVRKVLMPILLKSGSQLDDESLRTMFYEVMALVNSRPLSADNLTDHSSPEPLSPNNLLTMKTSVILPEPLLIPICFLAKDGDVSSIY